MVSKSINNKLFWLQLCNLDVSAGLSKTFWVTELLKIRLQAFGIASLFFREEKSKLCQLPAYIDSFIKLLINLQNLWWKFTWQWIFFLVKVPSWFWHMSNGTDTVVRWFLSLYGYIFPHLKVSFQETFKICF